MKKMKEGLKAQWGLAMLLAFSMATSVFAQETELVITKQLDAAYVAVADNGGTATLTFEVQGGENVSYQWYRSSDGTNENGTVIDGATESSWTTPSFKVNKGNLYYCVATAGEKSVKSNVTLVANTGLPTLYVNTPNGIGIDEKERWINGTELTLKDAGNDNFEKVTTEIRGRGNSTWEQPKKPYAIKLNKSQKRAILQMPEHRRWVLIANYLDNSFLKNHMAFYLSKKFELGYTVRGEFVNLVFNGVYCGLYWLGEAIKVDKNRVKIYDGEDGMDDNKDKDFLIEMDTHFDEVAKFYTPIRKMPYMVKNDDYIVEDVLNEKGKKVKDEYGNTVTQVSTVGQARLERFQNKIAALENLLYPDYETNNNCKANTNNCSAPDESYADIIDVESWAKFWLINEIMDNTELNEPKSAYFTYENKDEGDVFKAGPVWDFDAGATKALTSVKLDTSIYYNALFKSPKFIKAVKDVWNKYSSTIDFNTEIQTMRSKLAIAAKLDSLMWGDHKDYLENAISGFDGNVDFLKTSLNNKKGVVGKYVNNKVLEYVVQDGEVLTGTFGEHDKILIADGATVTLNNVTVNSKGYGWAGITCLGKCEIVLAENSKNTVKSFSHDGLYPSIYVPEGKTLTISGTGSLDASSDGYGAGIGGGWRINCGNIEINGGTIVARGGDKAAGIGSGYGGTVGKITISGSDTKVTAIKGENAPYSIGEGSKGSLTGNIIVGGKVTSSIIGSPFTYPVVAQYTVAFDANGGNGTMPDQSTNIDPELILEANIFTYEGYSFVGWNTKADGSGVSYSDQGHVNFTEVGGSITLYAQWYKGSVVNLASLKDSYTAKDGDVLTGTLGGNYKISIEKNATVTLNSVAINGVDDDNYDWAGITCLGKCEIVLAENSKNTVKGFSSSYAGIYVPEGNTLTISGTGSLDASSNGEGAGIGADWDFSCGNIEINGGTIVARGGEDAAGIGGTRRKNIGNIEINGGTIVATGGYRAAGIGGGYEGTIENITISGNDTKVTAIKGENAPYSIGEGMYGTRTGDITIGKNKVTSSIVANPFIYPVVQYTVTFDANGGNGTMANQSNNVVPELILMANGFTRDGYSFVGWNTKADGSGVSYGDQDYVNLVEVGESITLYAQWLEGNVVDLASLTGNYVAQNGVELTGMLDGDFKISIADGATVTFNNVIIDGVNDYNYNWAGITCLGKCNIILADNSLNEVKGFFYNNPGIYVPIEKTLSISGTGSLDASSNGYAAGIGCGYEMSCGNIEINGGTVFATGGAVAAGIGGGESATVGDISINGGTVTATGGYYAAGIGGGRRINCGNIEINGGTVFATGGQYAAGIGGGYEGTVGGITITDNVTKVTATKGKNAPYSIGKGNGGSREGKITIGGVVYDDIAESPFVYPTTEEYAAVQIRRYNSGTRAVIDGAFGGDGAVNITEEEIKVDAVDFNRKFLVGTYSTMVLPFDVNTSNVSGLDAVLFYNGIGTDKEGNDAVRMKVLWATKEWSTANNILDAEGKCCKEYGDEDLSANTPYLVKMKDPEFKVTGGVTLKKTTEAVKKYPEWEWEFRGTWEYKKWEKGDPELGYAYGFAASEGTGINVGDFVKVGVGAWICPMRAYLVRSDVVPKAQGVRANGAYVMRPSVTQTELPEFMSIIVDNGDGDDNNAEHTTVIGHFNTRTGEIKMNYDRGKFDLKGRRVNGTNNARGAYYGKKVLKK